MKNEIVRIKGANPGKKHIFNLTVRFMCLMVLICCISTSVYAADGTYETSEADPDRISITTEGRSIIFQQLPDTGKYSYCSLALYDEKTETSMGKEYIPYVNGMTYSTKGVEPGIYYLELYRGETQYSTYWSFFYKTGGIKLEIFSDHIEFVQMTTAPFEADSTFQTNHGGIGNVSIATKGRKIVFRQLPEADQYACCWVQLYHEGDKKSVSKETLPYKEGMTYSTEDVAPGIYYLELYRAKQRGSSYYGYFWEESGIKLQVFEDHIEFVQSPVYQNNVALYDSGKLPDTARDYYLQPSRGIHPDDAQIKKLAQSITKACGSDYDKVLKIHDWVCNNIWYDYDSYYGRTTGVYDALDVLKSKRSVCEGYANLTASLLRAAGIPAKKVSGYALGISTSGSWTDALINNKDTNHAWNEAYVDGRWVILDTTWDSSNRYENGTFSVDTGLDGYRYFDPTLEAFSYNHKIVNEDKIVPEAVVIKKVTNNKAQSAMVTWEKESGVSGYEVYRSTKKKSGYKKVKEIAGNATSSFQDTKLEKGKIYYYKVKAYKTVNGKKVYGPYSSVKKVKISK